MSKQQVSTNYVVFAGYAGSRPREFDSEVKARAHYESEACVPSYLNREVMQPVSLSRITTIIEVLETNRK